METTPEQRFVLLVNPASTTNGITLSELFHYSHLGLLTLGTSVQARLATDGSNTRVLYFDGALHGNDYLYDFLANSGRQVAVIGLSAHSHNYAACVEIARCAKKHNPKVLSVIGNDHFSALHQRIMRQREDTFDYGFYGNDVVEGFTSLVVDFLAGRLQSMSSYPGVVFRDPLGVRRTPENPDEYERLPPVDYSLVDSLIPHAEKYRRAQTDTYRYMREGNLNAAAIDIARGCIKFAGPRTVNEVPLNSCDFCGIVPGAKAITSLQAERAWDRIHGAVNQGYNYLLVTADSLPSTFWPLLRAMAESRPEWHRDMTPAARPRLMCYSRADSFQPQVHDRIDVLVDELNCDHFFIGLESFTTDSLRALAKGIDFKERDLLADNVAACQSIAHKGIRLTAGVVITHLGITKELMEANFQAVCALLKKHPGLFAELDFEPLMPIPGSLSFDYMGDPDLARARAEDLGARIDQSYLERVSSKYHTQDIFERDELVEDFIRGCCPDINPRIVDDYLSESRSIVEEFGIVGG